MKRKISKGLMLAGALLVLGAAGDSDTNALTFDGVVLKLIIGIALFAVGYILYKKVNTPKPKLRSVTLNNEICVNSKQATTPAYKNNFTTTKGICQL